MLFGVAAVAILAGPLYLWWTNYCFSEWRYVPKSEVCEKYLSNFPNGWLTPNSRCHFEPTNMAAFSVFPTQLSRHLYPRTQWGDVGRSYDSCGRMLKYD